jgi:acetoin utilization deacetylase AcuC-like enzyme
MEANTHDLVFFYPEGHQAHSELGHPERPERVESLLQGLQYNGWWDKFPHLEPIIVPQDIMQSIHEPTYLAKLETACSLGKRLDMDTYTTPASWELALRAAGGAIAIGNSVWRGEAKRGFALTRPPGHHATSNSGMGFCLLNNIAITAEYLIQIGGAKRLAIVDLDLHHGNGTQDIFWRRDDIFYISTHQYPYYPGTGRVDEIGSGPGKGTTANFPLPPGSGDVAFQEYMMELILPVINNYNPEMILISFGFDPHWRDPLGQLQLSAGGYNKLVSKLTDWADENGEGRIALFLEGGYDLEAASACGQGVVSALLGQNWQDPLGPSPHLEGTYWQVNKRQALEVWGL